MCDLADSEATADKISQLLIDNSLSLVSSAKRRAFISEMQFSFQEGVGCIEASFVISETIICWNELGSKVFSCFLDVLKAFDTVWIDGLLYKLFTELGVGGRMWLAIKDLCIEWNPSALFKLPFQEVYCFTRYRSGKNTCPLYVQSIY